MLELKILIHFQLNLVLGFTIDPIKNLRVCSVSENTSPHLTSNQSIFIDF